MICNKCGSEITLLNNFSLCPICHRSQYSLEEFIDNIYQLIKTNKYQEALKALKLFKLAFPSSLEYHIAYIYSYLQKGGLGLVQMLDERFSILQNSLLNSIKKVFENPKYNFLDKYTGLPSPNLTLETMQKINVLFKEYSENIVEKIPEYAEFKYCYKTYLSQASFKDKEKHRGILLDAKNYKNLFKEKQIILLQKASLYIFSNFFILFHDAKNIKKLWFNKWYIVLSLSLAIPTLSLSLFVGGAYFIYLMNQNIAINNLLANRLFPEESFSYNKKYIKQWTCGYQIVAAAFEDIVNLPAMLDKVKKGE